MRRIAHLFAAAAALGLAGCLEIAVKTTINSDGSIDRVVSSKLSSRELPAHGYPLPADTTWASSWTPTGDQEGTFTYSATKHFPATEDLEEEYAGAPDTCALKIDVALDRNFGWFSTEFDYREIYSLRNPFSRVPARSFFTEEEIGRIAVGERSDSLNARIGEWDFRNVFEEGYARLGAAIGQGDTRVNPATLAARKEEIFRLAHSDTTIRNERNLRKGAVLLLDRTFGKGAGERWGAAAEKTLGELDSLMQLRKSADTWVSTLVMPGTLAGANGEVGPDGEVSWKIGSNQLLVTPVVMSARSTVTNVWAIAATATAGLLLVLGVLSSLRKRSGRRA